MKRLKLALSVGALGLLIGFLHFTAIRLYLYWDIFWFDILMHFLGGAWVSLLGFWLLAFLSKRESFSYKEVLWVSIGFTLVVGVLWELFEYGAGLTFVYQNDWFDTISDLVLDVIGGLSTGYLVYRRYNVGREENTPL